MNNDLQQIADAAAQLAARLPHWILVSLAEAVVQHESADMAVARTAILHNLPTPNFRDAAADFLDHWFARAAGVQECES